MRLEDKPVDELTDEELAIAHKQAKARVKRERRPKRKEKIRKKMKGLAGT